MWMQFYTQCKKTIGGTGLIMNIVLTMIYNNILMK